MAEPLKNHFGPDIVHRIAASLAAVDPDFDAAAFTTMALDGFDDLELTARARHVAVAMARFLPEDRGRALDLVVASFGPEADNADPADAAGTPSAASDPADEPNPIAGFFYMPHGYFIAEHGGEHFDQAMRANYELTKRFTAEFSVRAHLMANPEAALAVLHEWAHDDNVHVRRLVSEGTRPRLPWASRLRNFQHDPTPILALLEHLKDDPVEYVRRSVANNLNDIAKDHPQLVIEVARRWWADGDDNRRRLVRHALRSLIKAGDPDALAVLGYGADSPARVAAVLIDPPTVAIGDKVRIRIEIENPSDRPCGALVDLGIGFVKANGQVSTKVFKGGELELGPGETRTVRKMISVAQHSTRTHYPGTHPVEVLVNGSRHEAGSFELYQAPTL